MPLAPASVTSSAVSTSQIDLAWDDVDGATGYSIERSTDGVSYSQIATTLGGVSAYSDTGLAESVPYHYRVRAQGTAGNSAYSPPATTTTLGTATGTVYAHFSGGNGTGSADQFAGVAGSGWVGAWQTSASTSTVTATTKSFGDAGYAPIGSRGRYLDLNTVQVGGGAANPAVGRQYTSHGGVTLTAVHVVRFSLRIDTLGTFTSTNDRITIVDNSTLGIGGSSTSTWEIRAYGANTGTALARRWAFYNGIRNGEGSVNNNRWVSSTMNAVAGTTYSFTVTTNPVTRTWSVSIVASDGQAAVNTTNLGYRTTATTARGFLSFSVRTNAAAEARDISLDSLTIDAS